jgi:hypothetical protein
MKLLIGANGVTVLMRRKSIIQSILHHLYAYYYVWGNCVQCPFEA